MPGESAPSISYWVALFWLQNDSHSYSFLAKTRQIRTADILSLRKTVQLFPLWFTAVSYPFFSGIEHGDNHCLEQREKIWELIPQTWWSSGFNSLNYTFFILCLGWVWVLRWALSWAACLAVHLSEEAGDKQTSPGISVRQAASPAIGRTKAKSSSETSYPM